MMSAEWAKLILELGGLGLAAYMAGTLTKAVNENTSVMREMYGFLKGENSLKKEM